MSENLSIFGKQIDGIKGIKATNTFGSVITYLDTSDANALSEDIISGKIAYVNGEKIVGTILTKSAQTFTPSTSNQVISASQYLIGSQTILGDANLIEGNIASGVTIFGITGSFQGGTNVSDTTVTAEDVVSGKYFYTAEGIKTEGTLSDAVGVYF